ncbi:MAG: tetratricopeptide repeat protein, partial [Chloroflexota bacterium]
IEIDPNHAASNFGFGMTFVDEGEDDRAESFLVVATENADDNGEYHLELAELYRRAERYDDANIYYGFAVSLLAPDDPLRFDAFFGRSRVNNEQDRTSTELVNLTNAIRVDPTDDIAFNNRGTAHTEQRNYARAIADLTIAVILDPEDPIQLANRGTAYRLDGQYDLALTDYNDAIALEPTSIWIYYNNRGLIHYQAGDYEDALADYNRAIEMQAPDEVDIELSNRGQVLVAMGRYDEAVDDLLAAIDLRPNNPWIHKDLGDAYAGLDDVENAVAAYQRHVDLQDAVGNTPDRDAQLYIVNHQFTLTPEGTP